MLLMNCLGPPTSPSSTSFTSAAPTREIHGVVAQLRKEVSNKPQNNIFELKFFFFKISFKQLTVFRLTS